MASLSFFYSSMNAGKTLDLIKTYYNFVKTDDDGTPISNNVICLTSAKDNRFGVGKIMSRPLKNGLDAFAIHPDNNLKELLELEIKQRKENGEKVDLILVDEVQFFSKQHIRVLSRIVDDLDIEVMCYGLRSNFKGEPFEGSLELMTIADKIREIKNRCFCGRKATMNLLFTPDLKVQKGGAEVQIGSENCYISLCRKHFNMAHDDGNINFIK